MKKFLICLFLITISCSKDIKKTNVEFSNVLSFKEFELKLNKYINKNPYPKMDN